jgi:hypothetical protein
MKRYLLIVICFFLFGQESFGQQREIVEKKIEETLAATLDGKGIADSIALYAFSIEVNIKEIKGKIVAEVTCNDTIAHTIFKDIRVLKNIDYKPIMTGRHHVVINIPVAYIVANYKANDLSEKKISIANLQESLYRLFNHKKKGGLNYNRVVYTKPIIITVDKAVYD